MKSVVQALWLLTVAFGDLIIIAIAATSLFSDRVDSVTLDAVCTTLFLAGD